MLNQFCPLPIALKSNWVWKNWRPNGCDLPGIHWNCGNLVQSAIWSAILAPTVAIPLTLHRYCAQAFWKSLECVRARVCVWFCFFRFFLFTFVSLNKGIFLVKTKQVDCSTWSRSKIRSRREEAALVYFEESLKRVSSVCRKSNQFN